MNSAALPCALSELLTFDIVCGVYSTLPCSKIGFTVASCERSLVSRHDVLRNDIVTTVIEMLWLLQLPYYFARAVLH